MHATVNHVSAINLQLFSVSKIYIDTFATLFFEEVVALPAYERISTCSNDAHFSNGWFELLMSYAHLLLNLLWLKQYTENLIYKVTIGASHYSEVT